MKTETEREKLTRLIQARDGKPGYGMNVVLLRERLAALDNAKPPMQSAG